MRRAAALQGGRYRESRESLNRRRWIFLQRSCTERFMAERAKTLETVSKDSLVPEWPKAEKTSGHWMHAEVSPRRVRVVFGGATLADSKRAVLLREAKRLPIYYFPQQDVHMEIMQPSGRTAEDPYKGQVMYWTIRSDSKTAENAAWSYADPPPACAAIKDHFAFEWDAMDAWYEEDEEIFVHARDPYKRVDAIRSARHVQIFVAGEAIADTRRPTLVFETNHPVRYYIPREDIRPDRLIASDTASRCPYKGIASYWSVKAGDEILTDLAWSYRDPIAECPKIKGLVCFFQEREAVIAVDGVELARPSTKWSRS
jgi:uncharacterized protein (DUF427 family)